MPFNFHNSIRKVELTPFYGKENRGPERVSKLPKAILRLRFGLHLISECFSVSDCPNSGGAREDPVSLSTLDVLCLKQITFATNLLHFVENLLKSPV